MLDPVTRHKAPMFLGFSISPSSWLKFEKCAIAGHWKPGNGFLKLGNGHVKSGNVFFSNGERLFEIWEYFFEIRDLQCIVNECFVEPKIAGVAVI